jgi:RNA polymerase sigma-70 factor (ECF subfamily)
MHVLADDVTLWTDGGGKAKTAVLRPISGREIVARTSLGSKRFWPAHYRSEVAEVNGQAALILRADGHAFCVLTIEVEHGKVQEIRIIANPEKLARV